MIAHHLQCWGVPFQIRHPWPARRGGPAGWSSRKPPGS